MRFFNKNIEEIAADRVLRWYGAALALANTVTALHWLIRHPVSKVLDPQYPAVCWPFFDNCYALRVLSPQAITALVWVLLLLALVNAVLFWNERFTRPAYWLLVALTLFKAAILFQDYRLRLNQHYMAYWTTLVFLLAPGKRRVLQYLLVLFYFWAGMLKLTPEWISGVGLYGRRPFGIPESLIPASCVYVIILELIIVFGVFSKREWVFWSAFLQLVLFHIASFWVVGFFYPILMFLLISLFPLARYRPPPQEEEPPGLAPFWRRAERPSTYALLAILCLLQLVPFVYPGDSSMTGEGRMFALHMFDAPMQCKAVAGYRTPKGEKKYTRMRAPLTPARISCDPIVYFHLARQYCRQNGGHPPLGDIDVILKSRKKGQKKLHTIIDVENFCATDPSYDVWRHNVWIHPPGEEDVWDEAPKEETAAPDEDPVPDEEGASDVQ